MKASGSPARLQPRPENHARHPSSLSEVHRRSQAYRASRSTGCLQSQPQMQAAPYGTNESLDVQVSGHTAYRGSHTISRQIYPYPDNSSSFFGLPNDNHVDVQHQADSWRNEASQNVSNGRALLAQFMEIEMTGSSNNDVSTSVFQRFIEGDLDLVSSYSGLGNTSRPQTVSPSTIHPHAPAQEFNPVLATNCMGWPRRSDVLPSSEIAMPGPWFGQQGVNLVDWAQHSNVTSMANEPWSAVNTRGNGLGQTSAVQAAIHDYDSWNLAMPGQTPGSPSMYSQSIYNGSSSHDTDVLVSETTSSGFRSEINGLISSRSTTKDKSAEQLMATNEIATPGRLYNGQGRHQVLGNGLRMRTDTPSRMQEAQHDPDSIG